MKKSALTIIAAAFALTATAQHFADPNSTILKPEEAQRLTNEEFYYGSQNLNAADEATRLINDYYLNTTVDGVYGVGGQIFMDYVNQAPGMIDAQTIIYGHHLKNGAMFKQIADMENQGFFDSIHTIWYVTRDATYKLQPLFLYYTNPDDTNVRVFSFESDEAFRAYLLDILHNKGVTMNPDAETIIGSTTRVLTLSTCNYIEGQGRSILVCVEQSTVEAALGTTETTS